jgi:hypothetical protein
MQPPLLLLSLLSPNSALFAVIGLLPAVSSSNSALEPKQNQHHIQSNTMRVCQVTFLLPLQTIRSLHQQPHYSQAVIIKLQLGLHY